MHWISPADEKTHEEYLEVLARGNFDLVLKAIGEYLGLETLVAYHLTFIGVSHSEKGFIHRDTHHTGASVYNVIIPLILEEDSTPELEIQDWDDDKRFGTLKYQVGMAAMMGDDAMHGTQACDYREKKGMRLAATIYIADVHAHNAEKIAHQTLTQIFPIKDAKWVVSQTGRHWEADNNETSLVTDKGRKHFVFRDMLSDCAQRAADDMCTSEEFTRRFCLRSCNIYEPNGDEDEEKWQLPDFYVDYENYKVGQYIDAFFDSLDNNDEEEECIDESDECEEKASEGMCMTKPDKMEELGCHRSCLYCLTSSSRELFSLGKDQQVTSSVEKEEDGSSDDNDDSSDDDDSDDEEDELELPSSMDILEVMAKTEYYFISEVLLKDDLRQYRIACQNLKKKCSYWAAQGHCEESSSEYAYMTKNCAAACQRCPLLVKPTCVVDESTNILQPGDLNASKYVCVVCGFYFD